MKLENSLRYVKLLPLQGALLTDIIPRALPWAKSFCPFRACGAKTCEPSAVCASPKESRLLQGLSAFVVGFLRGLNLVNDCSKRHEI